MVVLHYQNILISFCKHNNMKPDGGIDTKRMTHQNPTLARAFPWDTPVDVQPNKKNPQKCVLHPFFNINLANICTLLCVIFHVFDNVYGYIEVSLIQVWIICWQVMLTSTCRMQNFCQIKSLRYSHNPWQSVLILYVHSSRFSHIAVTNIQKVL